MALARLAVPKIPDGIAGLNARVHPQADSNEESGLEYLFCTIGKIEADPAYRRA